MTCQTLPKGGLPARRVNHEKEAKFARETRLYALQRGRVDNKSKNNDMIRDVFSKRRESEA